ncbi:hypothetical protein [Microbulbifer aggregans]|uniref:hypothetical protein n=1 Tax=Microbulbifer aggregans TaxID=1769779 RepID=UPI0011AB83E2|nr:hypothetical protein [Microbulbifer aggregans]
MTEDLVADSSAVLGLFVAPKNEVFWIALSGLLLVSQGGGGSLPKAELDQVLYIRPIISEV